LEVESRVVIGAPRGAGDTTNGTKSALFADFHTHIGSSQCAESGLFSGEDLPEK